MFTKAVTFVLNAMALGVILGTSVGPAEATTLYTIGGGFGGVLVPTNTANQTDVFSTSINGTLNFDEAAQQATLVFSFSGGLFDSSGGPRIGNLSGSVTYIYENVHVQNLVGPSGTSEPYLLSLTSGEPGNGVAAFANITLTQNGISDTAVFDLNAKPLVPNGSEPWFGDYNPVSTFLKNQGLGAFLIVGDLNGFDNAVKSWFMSAPFLLNLGNGRNGEYTLVGDLHATFTSQTEVPEPASLALLGAGLLGAAVRKRKAVH